MLDIRFDVSKSAGRLATEFRATSVNAHRRVEKVVRHYTRILETRVKAHASGRPGPNAPTGDYRRSITHSLSTGEGGTYGEVGTNEPQGRRLEFGFMGLTDSLGRTYHQPPYEHFGPALDSLDEEFPAAVARATLGGLP